MDTTKLKIKIGNHEFEADGPVDAVQSQFEAFKEMVGKSALDSDRGRSSDGQQNQDNKAIAIDPAHVAIEKLMHVSGRIISLTALPPTIEDAALLIMLGHKDLRNNLTVTGQEIGDGLAQSGRPVPRVDRIMDKAITTAYVLKTGIKRATRYRLTNQGLAKTLNVARELIDNLP